MPLVTVTSNGKTSVSESWITAKNPLVSQNNAEYFLFTSKHWSNLCMFVYLCASQVNLVFLVCEIFMTFECSHHMHLVLGPSWHKWFLSFWKQFTNKILFDSVSHEIGCSASHNCDFSKTSFTKYLRISVLSIVYPLWYSINVTENSISYYWEYDLGGKTVLHVECCINLIFLYGLPLRSFLHFGMIDNAGKIPIVTEC